MAAVKEVLDRAWGRPRQQAVVDVRVEGHVAHHQVLLEWPRGLGLHAPIR